MKPQLLSSITASAGFTLIEMMVVVTILAILMMIATPSLRDAMLNARMTAMVNDTMADLNVARSEAVKRNSTVTLCASTDGATCSGTNWAQGWIVFAEVSPANGARNVATEELIRATPAISNTNPNALSVLAGTTPVASISYGPSGAVTTGALIEFTFCDVRAVADTVANPAGRKVIINMTGRPAFSRFKCAAP
jgi:type IV fimbrial biogenesis protein FimT